MVHENEGGGQRPRPARPAEAPDERHGALLHGDDELLGRRLHDQLKAHSGLFSEAQGAAGFQRPLLVLMERSADLGAMMQHAWSYSALCHDLLGMKLNRVTIDERGEGGGKPQQATYDLHQGDPFWVAHIGAAFQTVAADVDRDLNEYREKMEEIGRAHV